MHALCVCVINQFLVIIRVLFPKQAVSALTFLLTIIVVQDMVESVWNMVRVNVGFNNYIDTIFAECCM